MITVVAAVVKEGGAYLVTRRLEGSHLAGLWEFPGGKVGEGETHADALRREIREELDADADVGGLVLATEHTYGDRTVALHFYWCRLRGVPKPMLGQEMQWVSRHQLGTLEFPAADEELITRLTETDRT